MTQSSQVTQEAIPEQISSSAEEGAQAQTAVQEFIGGLIAHVPSLEAGMGALRARVKRKS